MKGNIMGYNDRNDKASKGSAKGGGTRGKGKRARPDGDGDYQLTFDVFLRIQALCSVAVKQGGALRIGVTRDGGALALGVYAGDEYGTEYVRPTDDLDTELSAIAEAWFKDGSSRYGEELDVIADTLATLQGGKARTQ